MDLSLLVVVAAIGCGILGFLTYFLWRRAKSWTAKVMLLFFVAACIGGMVFFFARPPFFWDMGNAEGVPEHELAPPLNWELFSFARLEEAKAQKKGVVLFFTADWCKPCQRLKRGPLRDPKVQELLKPFVLFKVDLTEKAEEAKKVAATFQVRMLPTLVFLSPEGKEAGRITGYTARLFAEIQGILNKGG